MSTSGYGLLVMFSLGLISLLMYDWVCCRESSSEINIWPQNQHSISFSRVWTFTCSSRSDVVVKVSSHWLHLKGFLSVGIASKHFKCETILMCFFSCSDDLNHILHKEHSNGLSSLCTTWCFFSSNFDLKAFRHCVPFGGLGAVVNSDQSFYISCTEMAFHRCI